ncbi:hypothetical protein P171DRAFT_431191 [Karstenula rhodostoma CBS 690.94]|uniref:Uncharacterized protein n=1 Tax=Karstenula rhodostoma CBS 690.94 TaxID=1392251 RepID=A0A9P4UD50_9PLEO|nr:hypothetical protein P171DRAFT_431191 [Karstenula rhodostoma CBS 690.94]
MQYDKMQNSKRHLCTKMAFLFLGLRLNFVSLGTGEKAVIGRCELNHLVLNSRASISQPNTTNTTLPDNIFEEPVDTTSVPGDYGPPTSRNLQAPRSPAETFVGTRCAVYTLSADALPYRLPMKPDRQKRTPSCALRLPFLAFGDHIFERALDPVFSISSLEMLSRMCRLV